MFGTDVSFNRPELQSCWWRHEWFSAKIKPGVSFQWHHTFRVSDSSYKLNFYSSSCFMLTHKYNWFPNLRNLSYVIKKAEFAGIIQLYCMSYSISYSLPFKWTLLTLKTSGFNNKLSVSASGELITDWICYCIAGRKDGTKLKTITLRIVNHQAYVENQSNKSWDRCPWINLGGSVK